MASTPSSTIRRARGFQRAGVMVAPHLEAAARRFGFAEARLLTEWDAIVGVDLAAATRPVKVTRGRGAGAAAGGTLVVQAIGARGPEVQMMLPTLRQRVNAALGWAAIAHVRLTQAGAGFAEPVRPYAPPPPAPDPRRLEPLITEASSIGDDGLRGALETLARNVISRSTRKPRSGTDR
jgi:hypothetical protein